METPVLDDIVLFEIPVRRAAEQLLSQLTPKRLAWLQADGSELSVIGALINPHADDLSELLRHVQAWLADARLAAIRFELDGRTYVLTATRVPVAA